MRVPSGNPAYSLGMSSPGRGPLTPRVVERRLARMYGRPEWIARGAPLDQLIGTVLSQHTSDLNSDRAFARLKHAFPSWEEVRDARAEQLQEVIREGGLAVVKADRIQAVLRALTHEDGQVLLPDLHAMGARAACDFLLTLPGVGRKTASCVLLFAVGLPAMPVDTHVHRVVTRLGLIPNGTHAEQACDLLEEALPPSRYYAFHINLIRHGRSVCKAQRPRCDVCDLNDVCSSVTGVRQGGRNQR